MGTLLWQLRFGFTFSFQDHPRPHLWVILDGYKIGREFRFGCWILIIIANDVKYNYFCDDNVIDNVTLSLWKFLEFISRQTVGGNAGDDSSWVMSPGYVNLAFYSNVACQSQIFSAITVTS